MSDLIRPLRLEWEYGSAEVQRLGGMLGPLTFRLGAEREIDVMHVAPWTGMREAAGLPGLMRRLRGEWPCVPFGRVDPPDDLPPGWAVRAADDHWSHGYGANHRWECLESTPSFVRLAIDYPADAAVSRIERTIAADPHSPAVDIRLSVWSRRPSRLPVGLHPTFRLPPEPGRVRVLLGAHDGVFSYPSRSAGAVSRLKPDTRSAGLSRMAGADGPLDLGLLPLDGHSEELMQVHALSAAAGAPPFALHYLDYDACVGLWWDTAQLPDLMLWVSNGGRLDFPWMSRHLALGAEPVNSLFDLGRVARAPSEHPLAGRAGVALTPDQPWHTRYRIAAWPQSGPAAP
ncbi:hypothetical protein [Pseudoduganella namucuonensis]|uniref:Galactose mutarotase n=1 Tax=Pseudoduganella namucuonensis TaxID=1035707 RepID=A0A1I7H789_9BURK|nr:hypothetical protein [Pseudoduganella namucuonensis]SFU56558.1 hypothetical protein SAMN05216552_100528 [Pseudoduganella namucuonensis]